MAIQLWSCWIRFLALKLPMIPVGTVPAPQQSMYSSSPMTLVKKN